MGYKVMGTRALIKQPVEGWVSLINARGKRKLEAIYPDSIEAEIPLHKVWVGRKRLCKRYWESHLRRRLESPIRPGTEIALSPTTIIGAGLFVLLTGFFLRKLIRC